MSTLWKLACSALLVAVTTTESLAQQPTLENWNVNGVERGALMFAAGDGTPCEAIVAFFKNHHRQP